MLLFFLSSVIVKLISCVLDCWSDKPRHLMTSSYNVGYYDEHFFWCFIDQRMTFEWDIVQFGTGIHRRRISIRWAAEFSSTAASSSNFPLVSNTPTTNDKFFSNLMWIMSRRGRRSRSPLEEPSHLNDVRLAHSVTLYIVKLSPVIHWQYNYTNTVRPNSFDMRKSGILDLPGK